MYEAISDQVPARCVIYHGEGITPESFADDPAFWRPLTGRLRREDVRVDPVVVIVDRATRERIDELVRLPQQAILLAMDDASDAAIGDRTHASVAGIEKPSDRRRVLDVACRLACARAIALQRRRLLAQGNRRLRHLHEVSVSLMQERDRRALLRRIVSLGKELTGSDGAALFLADMEAQPPQLLIKFADFDSLPDVRFQREGFPIDGTTIGGHAAMTRKPIIVDDAYHLPPGSGFLMEPSFDEINGYRRRSMLWVPMVDQRDELVGLLVFVNRKVDGNARITDEASADRWVISYSDRELRVAQSLASQAAISIENVNLYAEIERMIEGIVLTSVTAIDHRDPATAGHSTRVADLTLRLARAVDRATDGPFANVHFSREQLRELHFAALLHDFGKIAVREAVLVKAKKLPPALWERVDARFALIRRTIELDHARGRFDDLECRRRIDEVDRMHALVRDANEPNVLEAEPATELRRIARCTFEPRDGVVLPYLTEDELHFLELPRGTLDDEERAQVESHVAASHELLTHIPWTDDLKHVPDFAYGHHEKLNGTGYPQHLKASDIPLQTRMITLADMFDALTETDRPYKPAVPEEKAIAILRAEAEDGKLDRELIDIMASSGAYRRRLEDEGSRP